MTINVNNIISKEDIIKYNATLTKVGNDKFKIVEENNDNNLKVEILYEPNTNKVIQITTITKVEGMEKHNIYCPNDDSITLKFYSIEEDENNKHLIYTYKLNERKLIIHNNDECDCKYEEITIK